MAIMNLEKVCARCGIEKPLEVYNKDKSHPDGKHPYCRSCRTECNRLRRNSNPILFNEKARMACHKWNEKNPRYKRNYYALTRYGISGIELTAYAKKMTNEQNNKCAICGITGTVIGLTAEKNIIRLIIDHNHKTNKLRGLLCDSCNRALGCVKENKDIIKSLLLYIEKWEG
jgi:hypothetical protein